MIYLKRFRSQEGGGMEDRGEDPGGKNRLRAEKT
jgi:hypothetical protein